MFTIVFIALWRTKRGFSRTVADWTLSAALVSRISLSLLNSLVEGAMPVSYLVARSAILSPVSILMNVMNLVAVLLALSVYTFVCLPARIKAATMKPFAEKA